MSDEPEDGPPQQPKPTRPSRAKPSSTCADLPYSVGKYKPPVEHRFKKGNKGGGRPKGAKNRSDYEKLLDQRIVVGHDARGRAMRKRYREVVDLQLLNKAAKGDLAAIKIVKEFEIKLLALRQRSGAPPPSPEEARRDALERQEKEALSARLSKYTTDMLTITAHLKRHGLIEIGADYVRLSAAGRARFYRSPEIGGGAG